VESWESCGSEYLRDFSESSGENVTYRSTDLVVGFVEALGTWVERSLLKKSKKRNSTSQPQFYIFYSPSYSPQYLERKVSENCCIDCLVI